jgi:pimeloyl-ACP methyl ester carboxylesterase
MEVLPSLRYLLERDVNVFCMDFSGSGWSGGEFISVGHWEQQDLRVVITYLRSLSYVSSIALWGRSMGAVTAILRAAEDPNIAACVLDSPFLSVRHLAQELVANKRISLPSFLYEFAFQLVRGEVQSRAMFDIETLSAIDLAPHIKVPALFGVATEDTFVLNHHAEDLYKAWGGSDRAILHFRGQHNTSRPLWFLEAASDFLEKRLAIAAVRQRPAPTASRSSMGSLAVRQLPLEKMPLPRPIPVEIDDGVDQLPTSFADYTQNFFAETPRMSLTTPREPEVDLDQAFPKRLTVL